MPAPGTSPALPRRAEGGNIELALREETLRELSGKHRARATSS